MTRTFKYQITGPTAWHGKRTIISRHTTLVAAKKALKLAKGHPDYLLEEIGE